MPEDKLKLLLCLSDLGLSAQVAELVSAYCKVLSLSPEGALLRAVELEGAQALVLDVGAFGGPPTALQAWLRSPARRCGVLVLAGPQDVGAALEALEAGAEHYLRLPCEAREIATLVRRLAQSASPLPALGKAALQDGSVLSLGSAAMRQVYARIRQVAPRSGVSVLISGETGVGKMHVAQLLHEASPRRDRPFIDIDCASIPSALIESELFGYEAGAYTDAKKRKAGLLELGQGGTVFLDEIGELPLEVQVKLLKVLEHRRFRRVGGVESIALDVRIVSATNRDLDQAVRQGRFRADLYYRLNAFNVVVPPLRERPEDLAELTGFFYGRACRDFEKPMLPLDQRALDILNGGDWPGNIRQLKSAIEKAVILADDYPQVLRLLREEARPLGPGLALLPLGGPRLDQSFLNKQENEEWRLRQALHKTKGNKTAAARLLGISKPTIFRKVKQYRIA